MGNTTWVVFNGPSATLTLTGGNGSTKEKFALLKLSSNINE